LTFRDSLIAVRAPLHDDCRPEALVPHSGDVAMCVHCGLWWARDAGPTGDTILCIGEIEAAGLALAPADPYETIAALDRAAASMEPLDGDYR
jgi:hypothetical protein